LEQPRGYSDDKTSCKQTAIWEYPNEYGCYSFKENAIDKLLNGSCYVEQNEEGHPLGYVCLGKSAQMPTASSNVYDSEYIDIGLGLHPALCGKGLGARFLTNCLDFGKATFDTDAFRLTVACFNKRAIKVYKKIGFNTARTVKHTITNKEFIVMLLPAA
jgi:ribosomal-protein-alanine N-acetyltransferase